MDLTLPHGFLRRKRTYSPWPLLTLRGVASDGVNLVAVGDGGFLLRSRDERHWTTTPSSTDEELFAIVVGAHGFAAVAGVEAIAVSGDGRAWSTVRVVN